MRIVCWQTILMKYHALFLFENSEKMLKCLSSAAVVIGALRVKLPTMPRPFLLFQNMNCKDFSIGNNANKHLNHFNMSRGGTTIAIAYVG